VDEWMSGDGGGVEKEKEKKKAFSDMILWSI
jgi:hypothetical protein